MKIATMASLLALIGAAHAQTTTYDYTGALMTGTETSGTTLGTPTGPFVKPASYAAGGFITLGAPLGDNLVDATVTPQSALFNIGGTAFAALNLIGPYTYVMDASFVFSTNASGQITSWDVDISAMQPGTNTPAPWTLISSPSGDTSTWKRDFPSGAYDDLAVSNNVAGSWTVAVPEISSSGALPAITLMLGLLALLRGRYRP